jgi:hypothetical protein
MAEKLFNLNLQHPALRASPERGEAAVALVLSAALERSKRFHLVFDRRGLENSIGPEAMAVLMPHLGPPKGDVGGHLRRAETYEDELKVDQAVLLTSLLWFDLHGRPDLALNHIEAFELFDEEGELTFGAYDSADSICFRLSERTAEELRASLESKGIPSEVVEPVENTP